MDIAKVANKYILRALTLAAAVTAVSCSEPMFDYEGDCDAIHRIRFVYDMNLKWANAFPSEVKSVNLFVFNRSGLFIKEYSDAGDALSEPGYSILLDLPADDYRFVAWCGLRSEGEKEPSFTVPQPVAGVTTIEELTCSLNTERAANEAEYSAKRLDFLYHGYLEATLEDNHDGTEYEHTIMLTKDTNHIRIILQELTSDEDMNSDHFSFYIESANSLMAYDNRLLAGSVVTYRTWSKMSEEVGVGKVDVNDGSLRFVKGVVADFTMARLMASQKDDIKLTVINDNSPDKEVVLRVPLVQYALLSKGYYEYAYGHQMDEQEMLDREDEYVMTFFLRDGTWDKSHIDIHQWSLDITNE